jgi:flagellar basal body-associated protein FliL
LSKYNANTRAHRSKNVIIIIIVAVVAIASGIVAAANAGLFQPPKAPSPPTTTTTASEDNKPMVMHIHPILSVYIDGNPVTIPENIGIDPTCTRLTD